MRGAAWLFTPADRPDRLRVGESVADTLIADLEDAVAPSRRAFARDALVAANLDPARTVVRVNAVGTADFTEDLAAVSAAGLHQVMLPKAESPEDVARLKGFAVVALVESPRGILEAPAIAASPGCVGLMWGSEDLAAGMGAWSSRDINGLISAMKWARAVTLAAARSTGILAIDAVDPRISASDALAEEAAEAAASGFDGKACIHPGQVPVIRRAFTPPADRVEWATRVLGAASEGAVVALDGAMIDEAVLRTARRVSRLASGP